MNKPKTVLGRNEVVSFPELGIDMINAKIDTGAYSTAIHAHKFWIEELNGIETLYFQLLDPSKDEFKDRTFKTTTFYRKKVRSSNGRIEIRFIIRTQIILGSKKRITHLSLTNREKMKYPVLIGRRVLRKGFIVDVTKSNKIKK